MNQSVFMFLIYLLAIAIPTVCIIIFLFKVFVLDKMEKPEKIIVDDEDIDEEGDDDFDINVKSDKKRYRTAKKEQCSFCGSTEHTIGGCPLFMAVI